MAALSLLSMTASQVAGEEYLKAPSPSKYTWTSVAPFTTSEVPSELAVTVPRVVLDMLYSLFSYLVVSKIASNSPVCVTSFSLAVNSKVLSNVPPPLSVIVRVEAFALTDLSA